MSEPVIKAWSYKCFQGCEDVEANHLDGIDPRSRHHHSVEPLYTRDDLVRVANAAYEHAIDHGWPGGAVIVDRLTKEET